MPGHGPVMDQLDLDEMMYDLGDHRIEEIATTGDDSSYRRGNRKPHNRKTSGEVHEDPSIRAAGQNWFGAIKEGAFIDDDHNVVKGLDTMHLGGLSRANRQKAEEASGPFGNPPPTREPRGYNPAQPGWQPGTAESNGGSRTPRLNVPRSPRPLAGAQVTRFGVVVPPGGETKTWLPGGRGQGRGHGRGNGPGPSSPSPAPGRGRGGPNSPSPAPGRGRGAPSSRPPPPRTVNLFDHGRVLRGGSSASAGRGRISAPPGVSRAAVQSTTGPVRRTFMSTTENSGTSSNPVGNQPIPEPAARAVPVTVATDGVAASTNNNQPKPGPAAQPATVANNGVTVRTGGHQTEPGSTIQTPSSTTNQLQTRGTSSASALATAEANSQMREVVPTVQSGPSPEIENQSPRPTQSSIEAHLLPSKEIIYSADVLLLQQDSAPKGGKPSKVDLYTLMGANQVCIWQLTVHDVELIRCDTRCLLRSILAGDGDIFIRRKDSNMTVRTTKVKFQSVAEGDKFASLLETCRSRFYESEGPIFQETVEPLGEQALSEEDDSKVALKVDVKSDQTENVHTTSANNHRTQPSGDAEGSKKGEIVKIKPLEPSPWGEQALSEDDDSKVTPKIDIRSDQTGNAHTTSAKDHRTQPSGDAGGSKEGEIVKIKPLEPSPWGGFDRFDPNSGPTEETHQESLNGAKIAEPSQVQQNVSDMLIDVDTAELSQESPASSLRQLSSPGTLELAGLNFGDWDIPKAANAQGATSNDKSPKTPVPTKLQPLEGLKSETLIDFDSFESPKKLAEYNDHKQDSSHHASYTGEQTTTKVTEQARTKAASLQKTKDALLDVEALEDTKPGEDLSQECLGILATLTPADYTRLLEKARYCVQIFALDQDEPYGLLLKRAALRTALMHLKEQSRFENLLLDDQRNTLAVVYTNILHGDSRVIRGPEEMLDIKPGQYTSPQAIQEVVDIVNAEKQRLQSAKHTPSPPPYDKDLFSANATRSVEFLYGGKPNDQHGTAERPQGSNGHTEDTASTVLGSSNEQSTPRRADQPEKKDTSNEKWQEDKNLQSPAGMTSPGYITANSPFDDAAAAPLIPRAPASLQPQAPLTGLKASRWA